MPYKPKKPCAHPGCANLTSTRYCEAHSHLEQKHYESSSKLHFYSSPAWRNKRHEFLTEHPLCITCGKPAEIVDHIIPIRQGGAPLEDRNLQPLCWSCHSRKSIQEGSRYKRKTWTY